MKKIPFLDLKAQLRPIKAEINKSINEVIYNTDFILGAKGDRFEQEFSEFVGAKHAVGVDNGLSALELGMRALGIGEGDEILTPVNSFIASASAISFTGAKPVFVDCDDNYLIDLEMANKVVTKKTKAIMPVHLYGQMVDPEKVKSFAKKYNLFIIEDACQAHGASFNGVKAGSFGDFAAFSFYPGKNLGAFGDGGMLVTSDKKIYEKVVRMRNYGQVKKYHHVELAWNRRLDNIQAAVLLVKLKKLKKWNEVRLKKALLYNRLLADSKVVTPVVVDGSEHVFHIYAILCEKRDKLMDHLNELNIQTNIHYPIPIHLQKCYKNLGYKKGDFPKAETFSSRILSLPLYPELTDKQIRYICRSIINFYEKKD